MWVQNVPPFQQKGIAGVQRYFWGQRRYSIYKVLLNEKYYVAIFLIFFSAVFSRVWAIFLVASVFQSTLLLGSI